MALLKILSGENTGQEYTIEQDEMSVGRAPDNVIQVVATATSSHHCVIIRDGKKYTLKDLDSTNGTGLNGVAIREARLKPKDVITAGGLEILFDGDDVEVDKGFTQEAIGPSDTVRLANFVAPTTSTKPPTFGTRRDSKRTWIRIIIIVGVLALGALAWFLFKLFGPSAG